MLQEIKRIQTKYGFNDFEMSVLAKADLSDMMNNPSQVMLNNIRRNLQNPGSAPYTIIKGSQAQAKIFLDIEDIDQGVLDQVQSIVNHPVSYQSQVRIMPDCHYGKGSTVGTTIMLCDDVDHWNISPNVVGVDIGCGMHSYKLLEHKHQIDLKRFDRIVKKNIPSGFNIHQENHQPAQKKEVENLLSGLSFRLENKIHNRIIQSIGTLGGGNHFYELTVDQEENLWLTVHSGSRNLGVQVVDHHMKIANKIHKSNDNLNYLSGPYLKDYLNDMAIAQEYAVINRQEMLNSVVFDYGLTVVDEFDSVHNFVDIEHGIIRKGATSAKEGERLIIPLNMRDGSVICQGKGNPDWNYSAPHGAGRQLSRTQARKTLKVDDFKEQMSGIYSSVVGKKTLDEAPDAYKNPDTVLSVITDTCQITHRLRPIYNYKGS